MGWTYEQSTGIIRDQHGAIAGVGYSGSGACRNRPSAQMVAKCGPIPRGFWDVLGPRDTPDCGFYVLCLQPYVDTKTFGRDLFLVYGSCFDRVPSMDRLVLPFVIRKQIWESNSHILQVIT